MCSPLSDLSSQQIEVDGTHQTDEVHSLVLEEATVLLGDQRVDEMLGQIRHADWRAIEDINAAELLASAIIDDTGGLQPPDLLQIITGGTLA